MTYTKRCNCGELVYLDEPPSYPVVLCWRCQRKARDFRRKRTLIEKRHGT